VATIEANFTFKKETAGRVEYAELDDNGQPLEKVWSKIGFLYLRKTAFERGAKFPRDLHVVIETEGEVDGPHFA
jgi:hypothetical protein